MQRYGFITLALSVLLAGCASSGSLRSPTADSSISGTVNRGLLEPHLVEVTLEGKVFRGEWRTGAPTDEQKRKTTYPHRRHVGKVDSTLRADDNSTLTCRWLTHGLSGEGSCVIDGREYPLILK